MGVHIKTGKFTVFDMDSLSRHQHKQRVARAVERQESAANPADGDVPMSHRGAQMGRPIRVGDFISTLQRLNPRLIFRVSRGDPTKYGIYIPKPPGSSLTPNIHGQFDEYSGLIHITGMESGINLGGRINEGVMPEFSIIENDPTIILDENDRVRKSVKFKREIRGWRTVLAALFVEGHLTESQIEKEFKISEGRSSEKWQEKTGKKTSNSSNSGSNIIKVN